MHPQSCRETQRLAFRNLFFNFLSIYSSISPPIRTLVCSCSYLCLESSSFSWQSTRCSCKLELLQSNGKEYRDGDVMCTQKLEGGQVAGQVRKRGGSVTSQGGALLPLKVKGCCWCMEGKGESKSQVMPVCG